MTTPLENILSRVHGAKRSGKGWVARCPAHEDRTASLSLNQGDDGRALLKCFAGCEPESVVNALSLEMSDLFECTSEAINLINLPQPLKAVSKPVLTFSSEHEARRHLERKLGSCFNHFVYQDASGEHCGGVLRRDLPDGKKEFRPIAKRSDGFWFIGGMETPRPLFNLPEVNQAQSEIYVLEGEKAVRAASSLGLVATTSAGGSQAAGKSDWSSLAGKSVFILPDNDDPGFKYANEVAGILSRLQPPAIVKIIQLPGLPQGGDIVEWLETFGDSAEPETIKQALRDLVGATQPITPSAIIVQKTDTWPELSHDASEPAPNPFPTDCFPEEVKRFCEAVTVAQGCDIAFPAVLCLSAMAGAIGASHQIEVKPGWTELPVLWVGLIARPGTGKSPAQQAIFAPLRAIQKDLSEEFRAKLNKYKEDLEKFRKDSKGEAPIKPARESLVFSNTTVEALVSELQNSLRGMVCISDELAGWVLSMNSYRAGADKEWFLSSWSSIPLDYYRKTGDQAIFVPRPCVNIVGAIQPAKLGLLYLDTDDGFLSRFLLCNLSENRAKYSKEGLSIEARNDWEGFIRRLRRLAPEAIEPFEMVPRTITLSNAAHDAFEEFHDQVQEQLAANNEVPEILRGTWSKSPGIAARLALILNLGKMAMNNSMDLVVPSETMDNAIRLTKYFLEHAKRLAPSFDSGTTSQDRLRSKVLAWIARNRKGLSEQNGKADWSQLRHDLRASIPRSKDGITDDRALEQALDGLAATGHIRFLPKPASDKTRKPRFEVNPKLLD